MALTASCIRAPFGPITKRLNPVFSTWVPNWTASRARVWLASPSIGSSSAVVANVRCERSVDRCSLSAARGWIMRFVLSALDADERPQPRHPAGEPCILGRGDDGAHVLVRAGRLLGDAARRRAADHYALCRQIVLDLPPAPLLERGVAGHGAAGAVTGGRKGLLLARCLPGQDVRARPHAAPDEHRLADRTKRGGQAFMAGTEGPRCAFAMHEKQAVLAVDLVRLDLAGVVRHVEQQAQVSVRKVMREDAPHDVSEDLAVGERAVDRRTHGTEIALADVGLDGRAGKLAVGQHDG